MTTPIDLMDIEGLKQQAKKLKLYGLLARWDELNDAQLPLIRDLLQWEAVERKQRGLERRLDQAHLGKFKPLVDFDWDWPTQCDRGAVSDTLQLEFIPTATNIILMGPNGIGKSTIAQNIAHYAVLQGHTALFVSAAQMLGDLTAQDGDNALRRRLKHYTKPEVLVIDEVGYLSYGTRHADLLFEIVSRRYESKPTILTTNKAFAEWGEVFPNASCVVSLVDRLIHHSELIVLEGASYRMKEAKERAEAKKKAKTRKKPATKTKR
jgi:DNA replication protein DnaC